MHSPVLEVLEFRGGIESWYALQSESDPWIFRKNQVSSYCCMPHLKRIVVKKYRGTMREVEPVCFLLEHAPALEELLIICLTKDEAVLGMDIVDPALAESALKKLPMASPTCLIIVQ